MGSYRNALIDAVATLTGAPAFVEGTGGGCEAIMVGPLDNGAVLMLTDGDAGVPVTDDEPVEAWVVQLFPHAPCGECDVCDYPPFGDGPQYDASVPALLDTVRAVLSGRDDR